MTEKTIKALKILASVKTNGIKPNKFAEKFWGDDPKKQSLFTSLTNTGNGACFGKKAWLCAGSYLNKLVKKGLAARSYNFRYHISKQGKEILNNITTTNNYSTPIHISEFQDKCEQYGNNDDSCYEDYNKYKPCCAEHCPFGRIATDEDFLNTGMDPSQNDGNYIIPLFIPSEL